MNEAAEIAEWHVDDGFIKDDKKTVHMRSVLRQLETQSFVDTATDAIAADGGFENLF